MAYKTIMEEIADIEAERIEALINLTKPLLEPQVKGARLDEAPLLSLAISMKRIADFLAGADGINTDVVDYVLKAIREQK